LNANITAVNAVIMASNTMAPSATVATLTTSLPSDVTAVTPPANEMAPKTASYTASLPTTSISTTGVTTSNPNDASNINAIDSTPDTSSLTYSHEEVCILLEEARLDGYQEGYDKGNEEGSKRLMEGYRDGYEAQWKLDQEKEEQPHKTGLLEGYELGIQEGKEHKQRKWLTEGHGTGLCLLMVAHARALFRGAIILEEAETQTNAAPTTSVNIQTNAAPERRCAALQTEPPDDEDPNPAMTAPVARPNPPADVTTSLLTVAHIPIASTSKIETRAMSEAQTTTATCISDETTSHTVHHSRQRSATMETITDDDEPPLLAKNCCKLARQSSKTPSSPQPVPLTPAEHLEPPNATATSSLATPTQPPSTLPTSLTTATTTSSPASELPQTPHKRRHTLPSRPTAPQPRPQPLPPRPEWPIAVTMS
jgi:hypothetical protein